MKVCEIWSAIDQNDVFAIAPCRIKLIEYIPKKDAYICVDATIESELLDEYDQTWERPIPRKDILERYVRESI